MLAGKVFVGMMFVRRTFTHNSAFFNTLSYERPPVDLALKHVSIIHRHGDRAQIHRNLGSAYPECDSVTEKWKSLLPQEDTLKRLHTAAKLSGMSEPTSYERSKLYSGWDQKNSPYSQLTEVGAQQLIQVGDGLRSRYLGSLIMPDEDTVPFYCRSTNMCRTIQSLRALLVGLGGEVQLPFSKIPTIHSRQRNEECMYAQADGRECPPLTRRMAQLNVDPARMTSLEGSRDGHAEFEARMQSLLQFKNGEVRWMHAIDVLTCHHAHDFDHIRGVSEEDVRRVSSIAAWIWGVMHKDDEYNRLAIGRFLDNLLNDMHAALGLREENGGTHRKADGRGLLEMTKMSIYSGHDSTLVPILCALGIYEDCWPPYASCLSLEVAQRTTSGDYFVRAVFNDKQKRMLGCFTSDLATTECTLSDDGMWCPLPLFIARLRTLALSSAQYEIEMKKT